VPSDKRARQRAAREQKQAIIQKDRKRRRNLRRGGGAALVAAVIVLIVFLVNGSATKSAKTTTTTTSTSTSTTTSTFPTPTTQPLTAAAVSPTCPPTSGSKKRVVWFTKAPPACIPATSVWEATFKTSLGDIVVKMPAAASYKAVNNFVFLALYKYYDGTFFHRIIKGFIVQGGDPTGTGSGGAVANGKSGLQKYGYPGYSFTGNTPPASCSTKPTEAGCYQADDLVMANRATASSDGSQFFFILPGGQGALSPLYTLFGKVVTGASVLDEIGSYGAPRTSEQGTPTLKIYLLSVTVKQVSG
jgi:cyclophilin family peptidyl-prolyl cis-trans isomerase